MFGKSKDDNDQLPSAVQQPRRRQQAKSAEQGINRSGFHHQSRHDCRRQNRRRGHSEMYCGQVEGELRALTVLINEGAKVEGDVVAEELTISGQVKGTIHANRVKLNSTAVVEGDIFHRSLSIEENARFEGSSKREDNAVDVPRTLTQAPGGPRTIVQTKATAIQGNRKSNGAPSHDESVNVGAS